MGAAGSGSVKIELAARAVRDAERRAHWWREHRPAPGLFEDELRDALEIIRGEPEAGSLYPSRSGRQYRRLLLPRTRHHVYYRIVAEGQLLVVAIWNAIAARGPTL